MKRTLLLVLAAATLLTTLACQEKANTKVTPNHTTPTDAVATQPGTNRVYSLGVENQRKEISPTPNPPPSPTPEPTVAPREEVATPAPTARVITPKTVGAAGTDLLPPTGEQPGQTVEGVWLTFYDCDVEGYCGTTASGVTLKEGGPEEKERYAGCDPNYWSIGTNGTKMTIVGDPNGYIWKCVDTGSAVIGSAHWDVWFYSQTDGEAYLDTVGTIVTIKTLP